MGNTCTSVQKEQFEDKVEDAVDAAKEIVEDMKEKVGEAVEQAKEVAEDVKEKAEEAVEQAQETAEDVKEKVEYAVEHPKEAAADMAEAVTDAVADGQEKAEEVAEAVQEGVAEAAAEVKEAAAGAVEAAADTMTAAVAAVTGTLIVEFDDGKGSTKTVDFKTKELGFSFTRSGGGCCVSAPATKVVVSKVDKNQQAEQLGVKRGWALKAVNGTDVNGLEEATKLLVDGKARLAQA